MRLVRIQMATSNNHSVNSSSSPPIILMPTDLPSTVNPSAVIVKKTSEDSQPKDLKSAIKSNLAEFRQEATTLFTFQPKQWLNAFRPNPKFPLFVVGDIDGFVALFMNNLATLLAVILGLKNFFSDELIYGRIIPG